MPREKAIGWQPTWVWFRRAFSPRTLLGKRAVKDYLAIVASQVSVKPIQLLKGFVVARYLGPADYGVLKGVELISMLNKFGNLGFKAVATREMGSAAGAGDEARQSSIRNTAYTGEILLSCVLFACGVAGGLLFASGRIRIAIILASAGMFLDKTLDLLGTESVIQQRFVLISKVVFWSSLVGAILVMLTVPFFNIYGVLAVPIFVACFRAYLYLRELRAPYRFRLERKELVRQLRIGVPITLGTLAFGSYRYSERIMVGSMLGTVSLGLFGFADMVMGHAMTLFLAAIKVRKMRIFEDLGAGKFASTHRLVWRESALLVAGAGLVAALASFAVSRLVPLLLPRFSEAVTVCSVLVWAIPVRVMSTYTHAVLLSAQVNKQHLMPFVQAGATVLLVLGAIVLHRRGAFTLADFAVLDVAGYAAYHVTVVYLYKRHFYDAFVKTSGAHSA